MIMSYLSSLPKDLRNLLDHYINYKHWSCLSEILQKITAVFQYHTTDRMFRRFIDPRFKTSADQKIALFFDFLPNGIEKYYRRDDVEVAPGSNLYLSLKLTNQVLVTKEFLLNVILVFCCGICEDDNFHHLQYICGEINSILEQHEYDERYTVISYNNRQERKIISLQ